MSLLGRGMGFRGRGGFRGGFRGRGRGGNQPGGHTGMGGDSTGAPSKDQD